MPTTANTINYYVAADGTLRDGSQGSIAQQPRLNYGTEYSVTLSFPPSTIAEGDQLQVALNRTRTFFSSASATGDAPVAAVAKHDVTADDAAAQAVTVTLSTNTRAMIDQVNGIDHPVRGFFGVHVLRGQSFVTLAVADALMMSLESGPDAISPSLPVVDYPTREEAEQIKQDTITAQGKAEEAQGKAEEAQGKAEEAQGKAEEAQGKAEEAQGKAEEAQEKAEEAQGKAEEAQEKAETAQTKAEEARDDAIATLANKRDILQTLVTSSATSLEVEAGKSYNWTVSAASTIALAAADKVAGKETRIDIYIDLQDGGSVTGDSVTISDAVLQIGWYKLIWDGSNATLYSTKAGGAEAVITIPAATTAYTLQDNKHYQQVPDAIPTYTLPTASFDGLVHEITVLVDFMHVTSCSFVDASGVPVTLQNAISPQIGEAYIFRCYWYGKWRVVPLKIRNAATVSSATGVVEVSDAVAGDALALKMVAPRSVVVNQLVRNGNFADGTTGWAGSRGSISASNNELIYTLSEVVTGNNGNRINTASKYVNITSEHKYIVSYDAYTPHGNGVNFAASDSLTTCIPITSNATTTENTWTKVSHIVTAVSSGVCLLSFGYAFNSSNQVGDVFRHRNIQLVDLTQYFNGDQTLIDSITSWDDLVAYDPRFASYVEYNTGEVTGVQPTVKVSGKNLFDAEHAELVSIAGTITLSSRSAGTVVATNSNSANNYLIFDFLPVKAELPVAAFKCSCKVNGSVPASMGNVIFLQERNNRLCVYLRSGTTGDVTWSDIQVELSATATPYEPYHDGGTAQAPTPLFAVGDAADEFEAVSGVATQKTGELTFNGTENWAIYGGGVSIWRGFQLPNVFASNVNRLPYIVNQSVILSLPSGRTSFDGVQLWLGVTSTMFYVAWASTSYTLPSSISNWYDSSTNTLNLENFKTWLTNNNLMVRYALATPTTSQSTPTQITIQDGNNVAMQTDGGRTLKELALTYENLPTAN